MVSGWPEVRSCDQLVSLPSIRLGYELGLLGSRDRAHNHSCVFIDKLEGSTDPQANRVTPRSTKHCSELSHSSQSGPHLI